MFYRRERISDARTAGSFLAGCLVGMAVGVAVGIMLAPDSGQATRGRVARRAGQTRDQVLEAMEGMIGRREAKEQPAGADQEA
jgi:gas vesicle protein